MPCRGAKPEERRARSSLGNVVIGSCKVGPGESSDLHLGQPLPAFPTKSQPRFLGVRLLALHPERLTITRSRHLPQQNCPLWRPTTITIPETILVRADEVIE